MKKCSSCGQELNDEMDFCPVCGTPTNGNVGSETEVAEYDDRSWYETDIFSVALSPLMNAFDNGKFFLLTAKVIIDIVVTTFLLAQPLGAFGLYKNHELAGAATVDKTVELISAIVWLIIAIFSFGYWMRRLRRLDNLSNPKDEFVVIPLGTYLLQWVGEWLALVLTVGGVFAIIVSLADVKTSSFILLLITHFGFKGGIIAIVVSIVIVFIFRVVAERIRALAAIANNTSRLQSSNEVVAFEDEEGNDVYFNVLYIICILATVGFTLAAMFVK